MLLDHAKLFKTSINNTTYIVLDLQDITMPDTVNKPLLPN